MATICLDFKWLGFQISNPIRNPDHLQPFSFQPFKIQTTQAIWLSNRHYLSLLFNFSIITVSGIQIVTFDSIFQLLGVEIDVWLQHRLFIVETLMFNLHKNDHLLSLNKLEAMSHLDVALKVSNIASLYRSQDKQCHALMSLSR